MTKKDFVNVALGISYAAQEARTKAELKTIRHVAEEIADRLKQEYPRFNREIFLTKAGV